jgi:hypothetical protein
MVVWSPETIVTVCGDASQVTPKVNLGAESKPARFPKFEIAFVLLVKSGAPKGTILELFLAISWHVCHNLISQLD